MRKVPFKSGVHPPVNKYLTADKTIKRLDGGEIFRFPMSQHIGAPAEPAVKVGDTVFVGSKIGTASSKISAPVHSSVSGTVVDVGNITLPGGKTSKCVTVKSDGKFTPAGDKFGKLENTDDLSPDDLVSAVCDAGIVGLGGAGFPTAAKLSFAERDKIKYIIVNCAECEPYLTSDYRIMLERTEDIIRGLRVAMRIFSRARGVIVTEDNKKDAAVVMKNAVSNDDNIAVMAMKTKYPQGAERRIVADVTGKKINSSMLPGDVGAIVINAATAAAVSNAVYKNIPLVRRVITITGDGANCPGNYDVPIGANAKDILEQCGGLKSGVKKIICGGPMMGTALISADTPITKTFSSIIACCSDIVSKTKTTACIRCGRCVGACPENLVPRMMYVAAEHNDLDLFKKLGGAECIECGCCTFVCPAKQHLTQCFRVAKQKLRRTEK